MTTLNIDPNTIDPFYRYKMPAIEVFNSPGGRSVTKLVNLPAVSEALERDPKVLLRFLSSHFACASNSKREEYSLNGQYSRSAVQKAIYIFIQKFVLCKQCNNPETENGVCRACGFSG